MEPEAYYLQTKGRAATNKTIYLQPQPVNLPLKEVALALFFRDDNDTFLHFRVQQYYRKSLKALLCM